MNEEYTEEWDIPFNMGTAIDDYESNLKDARAKLMERYNESR